jgi:hypothetical protein
MKELSTFKDINLLKCCDIGLRTTHFGLPRVNRLITPDTWNRGGQSGTVSTCVSAVSICPVMLHIHIPSKYSRRYVNFNC